MTSIPVLRQTIDATTGDVIEESPVDFLLLPAKPGTCAECATAHEADWPHDATSLYYQYAFYGREGRWPDWRDAMAHCAPEIREHWTRELVALGVDVAGGRILP